MISVTVVVGNPKPKSRTADIATRLVDALLPASSFERCVIDLSEHAKRIFDWPSDEMTALSDAVTSSDLLVAASPTYKATYTGLLKAFFDRYPNLGLRGLVAIPMMTGNGPHHAMAPELSLRPLLVELGAVVPTQGLYFVMDQMDEADTILESWAQEARERLLAHLPPTLSAIGAPQHSHL